MEDFFFQVGKMMQNGSDTCNSISDEDIYRLASKLHALKNIDDSFAPPYTELETNLEDKIDFSNLPKAGLECYNYFKNNNDFVLLNKNASVHGSSHNGSSTPRSTQTDLYSSTSSLLHDEYSINFGSNTFDPKDDMYNQLGCSPGENLFCNTPTKFTQNNMCNQNRPVTSGRSSGSYSQDSYAHKMFEKNGGCSMFHDSSQSIQSTSDNGDKMEEFHCNYCFQRIYALANMIANENVVKQDSYMNYGSDNQINQPNASVLVSGPGIQKATRGKSSTFYIQILNPSDHESALIVNIVDPKGHRVREKLRKLSPGSYVVKYKPDFEGDYTAYITLNDEMIQNSPFTIYVNSNHRYQTLSEPKGIIEGGGNQSEWAFNEPWGISCSSDGLIAIGDRGSHQIRIFNQEFKYIKSLGRKGSAIGELCKPAGLSFNSQNDIIVADKDNHRVQVFGLDGNVKLVIGDDDQADWVLKYPWDVSIGIDDSIYVCDSRNCRISHFSSDGNFLDFIKLDPNLLKSPRGIYFRDIDSRLIVTDMNRHQIVVTKLSSSDGFADDIYSHSNSSCVDDLHPSLIGNKGKGMSEFNRPQGVTCDSEGNIIVCDSRNTRIQVFDPDGNYLAHWSLELNSVEVVQPMGVAVTGNGNVLVVDAPNNRVIIY